jgi:hypothetical protein
MARKLQAAVVRVDLCRFHNKIGSEQFRPAIVFRLSNHSK